MELAIDIPLRARSSQRLNPPYALADASLDRDHERSDLSGRFDVRATAQFVAVRMIALVGFLTHPDGAHALAVLFAEQGHGALGTRCRQVFFNDQDWHVVEDRRVNRRSDPGQFIRSDWRIVAEVKAQAIRRYERSALLNMRSEYGAQ